MPLNELLQESSKWLGWAGAVLSIITIISFFIGWDIKFRLIGATIFTLLLSGSLFTFVNSYTPPVIVEGAKYTPVVYDNGYDLVVAQAPDDFPEEAIQPTLEQIAGNLKGKGRNGVNVHVRLRKISPIENGISRPTIIGEVIRDLEQNLTIPISGKDE